MHNDVIKYVLTWNPISVTTIFFNYKKRNPLFKRIPTIYRLFQLHIEKLICGMFQSYFVEIIQFSTVLSIPSHASHKKCPRNSLTENLYPHLSHLTEPTQATASAVPVFLLANIRSTSLPQTNMKHHPLSQL